MVREGKRNGDSSPYESSASEEDTNDDDDDDVSEYKQSSSDPDSDEDEVVTSKPKKKQNKKRSKTETKENSEDEFIVDNDDLSVAYDSEDSCTENKKKQKRSKRKKKLCWKKSRPRPTKRTRSAPKLAQKRIVDDSDDSNNPSNEQSSDEESAAAPAEIASKNTKRKRPSILESEGEIENENEEANNSSSPDSLIDEDDEEEEDNDIEEVDIDMNCDYPPVAPLCLKADYGSAMKLYFNKKRTEYFYSCEYCEDSTINAMDEQVLKLPPVAPLCANCHNSMRIGRKYATGQLFFNCFSCQDNSFLWAEDKLINSRMPCGPTCNCNQAQPSLPVRDLYSETGRCLWVCAETNLKRCCNFVVGIGQESSLNRDRPTREEEGTDSAGSNEMEEVHHAVGGESIALLQGLFHLSSGEIYNDYRSTEPKGYYDYLQVQKAWKITSPQQIIEDFDEYKRQIQPVDQLTELRSEYASAIEDFMEFEQSERGLEELQTDVNEQLLLHGTKPEVAANILEKSLDPEMAKTGLFGRGTYFAEHPCKINQYTTRDEHWVGGNRRRRYGSVCDLHNKLYPRPDWHPGNVYYALVCRVVMGSPDFTYDRKERPGQGYHSILAEPGECISHYREFVVFDKRAIKIEYLVAYTREKRYCLCGIPVRQRTFSDPPIPIICCDNSYRGRSTNKWEGGCGLFSELPRCFCRNERTKDFSKAGRFENGNMFKCKKKRCGFRQKIDQDVDLCYSDHDDEATGEDNYDSSDSFIANEEEEEDVHSNDDEEEHKFDEDDDEEDNDIIDTDNEEPSNVKKRTSHASKMKKKYASSDDDDSSDDDSDSRDPYHAGENSSVEDFKPRAAKSVGKRKTAKAVAKRKSGGKTESRKASATSSYNSDVQMLLELGKAIRLGPSLYRGLKDMGDDEERIEALTERLERKGESWKGRIPTSKDISRAKAKRQRQDDLDGIDTALIIEGGRGQRRRTAVVNYTNNNYESNEEEEGSNNGED